MLIKAHGEATENRISWCLLSRDDRDNRGEDIFLTDKDRMVFLDGLANSCETYGIKLIIYVLMPNHFHLLVQTPQANLSEFMRHFLVTYTMRFNRRNGRTGHVFRGGLNHCWSMKMSTYCR